MEKKRETSHFVASDVSVDSARLAARFLDLRSESDIDLLVFSAAHNYDENTREFGAVIDSTSAALARTVFDIVILNSRQITGEMPMPEYATEAA